MAIRNSNNYRVAIVKESVFGQINKTLTLVGNAAFFNDKMEWNYAPITVERATKENSLYKSATRNKITGKLATGTISGDLTNTHEILLQGHFDDTTQAYAYPTHLTTQASYNVYQLYLDATGACTTYDVLLGVTLNPLSITGESNGIIQYSCTLDAASYLQEQANSSGTALTFTSGTGVPSAPSGVPFLFGAATASLAFSETKLNSFSMEFSKTLVDNAIRFQNSMTKTNDYYTQVGGTLSYTALWDGTNNAADQGELYDETAKTNVISLITSAVATWAFTLGGILTSASRPDADRGIYLGNYTFDLTSVSIAVS